MHMGVIPGKFLSVPDFLLRPFCSGLDWGFICMYFYVNSLTQTICLICLVSSSWWWLCGIFSKLLLTLCALFSNHTKDWCPFLDIFSSLSHTLSFSLHLFLSHSYTHTSLMSLTMLHKALMLPCKEGVSFSWIWTLFICYEFVWISLLGRHISLSRNEDIAFHMLLEL